MIKVLEQAIEKVKTLSEAEQRYAAQLLEQLASTDDEVYVLSDDEKRLVQEARDEIDQGKGATPAQVRAVYDKYRA